MILNLFFLFSVIELISKKIQLEIRKLIKLKEKNSKKLFSTNGKCTRFYFYIVLYETAQQLSLFGGILLYCVYLIKFIELEDGFTDLIKKRIVIYICKKFDFLYRNMKWLSLFVCLEKTTIRFIVPMEVYVEKLFFKFRTDEEISFIYVLSIISTKENSH